MVIDSLMNNTLNKLADKYMPLKKRPSNLKFKEDRPWITSGLKTSIKRMYELLRISKQSGSLEDYSKYKAYLNKLASLKNIARNNLVRNF